MLRLSLRVGAVCALRISSIKWETDRWTLTCKVKGGREEKWPLPRDVKQAIDDYLNLNRKRRETIKSGGQVARRVDYGRLGKLSPHDMLRTVVATLLNQGYIYRDIQMVTKHRDPKTVQRHDKGRESR